MKKIKRMVSDEYFLSLFSLSAGPQCCLSVNPGSAHSGCVQMRVGRVRPMGRVHLGVGGVEQLSVSFKDAQTALHQLEVSLQVRHRWTGQL